MTDVRAVITTRFSKRGYTPIETTDIESYMVDSAMDTDTDTWQLALGDPELRLRETLRRDNEVRVNIFGLNNGRTMNLHTGFADEIVLNEDNVLTFSGRDITAVAVDSQRPPGNFRMARPQTFVKKDALALGIGDRLRLTAAKPFKKFSCDGSESYWEVWYRFYRKRRMWIWAEPDATITAGTLSYNANPSYFFGSPPGIRGAIIRENWLGVERAEVRSNKQQRIWEVYVIGSRGDIGFVSKARDKTISKWIKKRQQFLRSSTAHNPAEARVEAYEELFEGKVGALEIKLTISDPGFIIRQNRVAEVNIPVIGLKGRFFVVGSQAYSGQDGMYQQVRLRELNYAISKRVPDDPKVAESPSDKAQFGAGGVGASLDVKWKYHFVEAANKHHGPWPYKLFLGVLLAICEQETGFRNVRGGGSVEYPGTANGQPPSVFSDSAYRKFASTFANDPQYGRTNQTYAVGPMQLYSRGYKEKADDFGGTVHDELVGSRWEPRYNIIGGAFALRDKLKSSGAEAALQAGSAESLIWWGVAWYGHHYAGEDGAAKATRYSREVKERYDSTYADTVEEAVTSAQTASTASADKDGAGIVIPSGSVAELRERVLNNRLIEFTRASQRDDIRYGLVDTRVLKFLLAFTEAGFPAVITALKSDHTKFVSGSGRVSAHSVGRAVDIGNYNIARPEESSRAQQWILNNRIALGYAQLIAPVDGLVFPSASFYGAATMRGHDNHIHVGWS